MYHCHQYQYEFLELYIIVSFLQLNKRFPLHFYHDFVNYFQQTYCNFLHGSDRTHYPVYFFKNRFDKGEI